MPMQRVQDIVGLDVPDDVLEMSLAAFADIAAAIRKLRMLDLTEEHPLVIYDPTLPYRADKA
jgi:hypothetical protein